MLLKFYKTDEFLDTYSDDGSYSDPIFKRPDVRFDGVTGQTHIIRLYLRNDSAGEYSSILVIPVGADIPPSEIEWMYLATSLAGLSVAIPGASLSLSNLAAGDHHVVWFSVVVPADTPSEDKKELALRVTAMLT